MYGYTPAYKFIELSHIVNTNFDIVIQMNFNIPRDDIIIMRAKGVKCVAYQCGNDYFFDMETMLFSARDLDGERYAAPVFDEIWSIPQHTRTNKHYMQTLYRVKCKEVPFIWSPYMLDDFEKECKSINIESLMYKNRGPIKKCAIFEPNLNVVKWCFPALLVCENTCRANPTKLDHVYVTNTNSGKFNIDYFNKLVASLDLCKSKKISIEARYNALEFMAKHADIAVSHQWENPLNYLYLDLAWMGWPIVHNAHLCKDVGYYYEGFNYEMGGKILNIVINNHDANAETYMKRNRAVIDRYLPTNKALQERYKGLIESVMRK